MVEGGIEKKSASQSPNLSSAANESKVGMLKMERLQYEQNEFVPISKKVHDQGNAAHLELAN